MGASTAPAFSLALPLPRGSNRAQCRASGGALTSSPAPSRRRRGGGRLPHADAQRLWLEKSRVRGVYRQRHPLERVHQGPGQRHAAGGSGWPGGDAGGREGALGSQQQEGESAGRQARKSRQGEEIGGGGSAARLHSRLAPPGSSPRSWSSLTSLRARTATWLRGPRIPAGLQMICTTFPPRRAGAGFMDNLIECFLYAFQSCKVFPKTRAGRGGVQALSGGGRQRQRGGHVCQEDGPRRLAAARRQALERHQALHQRLCHGLGERCGGAEPQRCTPGSWPTGHELAALPLPPCARRTSFASRAGMRRCGCSCRETTSTPDCGRRCG